MRAALATFALSALMLTSTVAMASSPCDGIAQLYSSCGKKFDYDGHAFYFNLKSGPRTALCDDGRKLGYYDRMDDMDVLSVTSMPYTAGATSRPEKRRNWDPGRLRNEDLLKAVYGSSESDARAKLVKVSFLNQNLMFSSQLGAAAALSRAGLELQALAKSDKDAGKFLAPFLNGQYNLKGNTFFWRVVHGTPRLSAHSFGAAIDLLTNVGPMYWLWDEMKNHPAQAKQGEQAYRNTYFIPPGPPIFNQKVVDVMEANGFIWGGKWNHYDTMHFEYRPELLPAAKVTCKNLMSTQSFAKPTAQDFIDAESVHPADHD
jgi:hypothetical protein